MSGKFAIGGMVRHIAAIERYVFAEDSLGNKANYKGCGYELADSYENIISYFNEMHSQSIEIYEPLCCIIATVDGRKIVL